MILTGPPLLVVEVATRPAPQGSKNCTCKGGKAIMFEQTAKHLKPFRRDVKAAALAAMEGRPPFDMPIELTCTFTIERPADSKFRDYPAGVPDVSKLTRALEDSLTDAKVWTDDCRVVDLHVVKVWTGAPGALPYPGIVATVAAMPELVGTDDLAPTVADLSHPSGGGV